MNLPKALFYLLKGDYRSPGSGCKVQGWGFGKTALGLEARPQDHSTSRVYWFAVQES